MLLRVRLHRRMCDRLHGVLRAPAARRAALPGPSTGVGFGVTFSSLRSATLAELLHDDVGRDVEDLVGRVVDLLAHDLDRLHLGLFRRDGASRACLGLELLDLLVDGLEVLLRGLEVLLRRLERLLVGLERGLVAAQVGLVALQLRLIGLQSVLRARDVRLRGVELRGCWWIWARSCASVALSAWSCTAA